GPTQGLECRLGGSRPFLLDILRIRIAPLGLFFPLKPLFISNLRQSGLLLSRGVRFHPPPSLSRPGRSREPSGTGPARRTYCGGEIKRGEGSVRGRSFIGYQEFLLFLQNAWTERRFPGMIQQLQLATRSWP